MTTASSIEKTGNAFAVTLLACCLFAFPVGAAENLVRALPALLVRLARKRVHPGLQRLLV